MNLKYDKQKLIDEYNNSLKDPEFKKLVARIKPDKEKVILFTSKLKETCKELHNCEKCKGLMECKNDVEGYVMYPDSDLNFAYLPCKYEKEFFKKKNSKITRDKELENAKMADIDLTDKNRLKAIKWIKDFYKNYDISKKMKGLYLHGSYGTGKTYLICALFNELKNLKVNSLYVYYPEILSKIKSDFDSMDQIMNSLKEMDVVLIDDIGAEKNTEWSRDEILGTVLEYRMRNYLPTFFTSNLTMKELEDHFRLSNYSDDEVKVRRIMERIRTLTDDIEMNSENRRDS
jgi:primosomal protein DnaI